MTSGRKDAVQWRFTAIYAVWPLILFAVWRTFGGLVAMIVLGGGAVGLAILTVNWLFRKPQPPLLEE